MAILDKLFGKTRERDALIPLYNTITERARDPQWYKDGGVPDTQDGRFDMIAAILSLVLMRLEGEGKDHAVESALLAEVFIDDMDSQLREIGISDVVVGKHMGKMMGALGGRMSAYRTALSGEAGLEQAIARNLYRGEETNDKAMGFTAERLRKFHKALQKTDTEALIGGSLPPL